MLKASDQSATIHCGYVALVGRPNVGKSTLLNQILKQKISITCRKPHTTRQQLLGVKTEGNVQAIYLDMPGIRKSPTGAMNRYMNKQALNAITGIDVLIYLIEAMKWRIGDEYILQLVRQSGAIVILAVNKIDKIADKQLLLPFFKKLAEKMAFASVIPLCALEKNSSVELEKCVAQLLPARNFQFPKDQLTDRNEHYFAAEFLREKLIRRLGDELPYHIAVTIESFTKKNEILHINAVIWVANATQKAIVIGKNGGVLKVVGERARKEMEFLFGSKVFLQSWVKVKEKWMDNTEALKTLGYCN